MARKFQLLSNSSIESVGTIGRTVYACTGCDYGCASDDTRLTGVEHISVTLKEDGSYPFFTHPKHLLKEIKE